MSDDLTMANDDGISGRAFGQVEGNLRSLSFQVAQLTKDVEDLRRDIRVMQTAVDQVKGGWWVITALGAVVAAVSSAATWLLSHVQWR